MREALGTTLAAGAIGTLMLLATIAAVATQSGIIVL
jgi:hypothetical protein